MNLLGRGLALTIVLTALAAVGGTWIGSRYVVHHGRSPSLHERVHHELGLSAEQERRLETLERDFAVSRRAREAELRSANIDLAKAIRERHEYSSEVQSAVEKFHGAMGGLQKETILHVLAMRKVLTPEQAVEFDRLISEALTEQTP